MFFEDGIGKLIGTSSKHPDWWQVTKSYLEHLISLVPMLFKDGIRELFDTNSKNRYHGKL